MIRGKKTEMQFYISSLYMTRLCASGRFKTPVYVATLLNSPTWHRASTSRLNPPLVLWFIVTGKNKLSFLFVFFFQTTSNCTNGTSRCWRWSPTSPVPGRQTETDNESKNRRWRMGEKGLGTLLVSQSFRKGPVGLAEITWHRLIGYMIWPRWLPRSAV